MYRIERKTINPRSLHIDPNDRTPSDTKTYALAAAMRRDGWQGEPVIVGPDLRHLDGQHRICAAVCAFLELIPVIVLHGPTDNLPDGWQEYVQAHPDGHTFTANDVKRWPYRDYPNLTDAEIAEIHDVPEILAAVIRGIACGAGWEFAAEDGELLVWPEGDYTDDAMNVRVDDDGDVVCSDAGVCSWMRWLDLNPGHIVTELETAWDEVMS